MPIPTPKDAIPVDREYDQIIRAHYDEVARSDGDSELSTMATPYVRKKETEFIERQIRKHLNNGEHHEFQVMDVGCGNGYTLHEMAETFPSLTMKGIEANDSLRKIAIQRFEGSLVTITKGDIRDSASLPSGVDILICQRVLINLLDHADQQVALKNLIDTVRPGGILIFIECFLSSLINLNLARKESGLDPLPAAIHNLYLPDNFFDNGNIFRYDNTDEHLLSTHYFVTRVLHEAHLKSRNEEFVRNSHFVSFFTDALPESIGNYSPLRFLCYMKTAAI